MPPKPAQAGKFKPLKRPPKPTAKQASTATASNDTNRTNNNSPVRERGRGGSSHITEGRGRGRGRFVAPTGAAFFTGASTKQSNVVASAAPPLPDAVTSTTTIAAGQDGAVVLPFTKPFGNDAANVVSSSKMTTGVARTAAESMAAAARAKLGEGEEIIVAEMDVEEEEQQKKKVSVLEREDGYRKDLPSLFDEENADEMIDVVGVDSNYVYDSDSSEEERRRERKKGGREGGMLPLRLPFPLASYQNNVMYACQENVEEKKDGIEGVASSMATSQLADPEENSPFLDWNASETRDDMKFNERNSWFLMKFPTRLPHLDHGSLVGGASKKPSGHSSVHGSAVKSEINEDGLEVVGSNADIGDAVASSGGMDFGASELGASGTVGYDNTLKDIAPGKYGKIVVYKSGRTELVVGGENGGPEVRMLINEGLQCGFRQEAVVIDHDEGTFVPMGDVTKSLVVTPDVESAFVFS